MANRKRKALPPVPDKPVATWCCLPHEKLYGVVTGVDNPLLVRLLHDTELTIWHHKNQDLDPGRVVTILKGQTLAVYIRNDLRALTSCLGYRVFIRCGRRVVQEGTIVYQRFDTARREPSKLPPVSSSSGETDELADCASGHASVNE